MIANLKELRMKYNISQQRLGEIIGVSQQSINKYENHNVEPDIKTLMLMADFFNTSIDYLVGYSKENRPETEADKYAEKYKKLPPKKQLMINMLIDSYLCD